MTKVEIFNQSSALCALAYGNKYFSKRKTPSIPAPGPPRTKMTMTLVLSKTAILFMTWRNKWVIGLTRLERGWVGLFSAFDHSEKGSKGGK
jgi:hypothetical protein